MGSTGWVPHNDISVPWGLWYAIRSSPKGWIFGVWAWLSICNEIEWLEGVSQGVGYLWRWVSGLEWEHWWGVGEGFWDLWWLNLETPIGESFGRWISRWLWLQEKLQQLLSRLPSLSLAFFCLATGRWNWASEPERYNLLHHIHARAQSPEPRPRPLCTVAGPKGTKIWAMGQGFISHYTKYSS